MIKEYQRHITQREELGIPPLPLTEEQTSEIVQILLVADSTSSPENKEQLLKWLISHTPIGVDKAARVKADFLYKIAISHHSLKILSPHRAVELLGTMQGGYNVEYLILLLSSPLAEIAAKCLKQTILIFDQIHVLKKMMDEGNSPARDIMESWANGEWFTEKPPLPQKITLTVFRVDGETNTDDLSPAPDAWNRSDIPLHALSMLKNPRVGISPDSPGKMGPISQIQALKDKGYPLAYVGDVVGTGSSRKSATNSMIWHIGKDIPFVPNKRIGGVCLAGKISPIFFNTQEDSGALPIELDVSSFQMGDVIDLYPYEGKVEKQGVVVSNFQYKSDVLLDEVQAGGRINLIIGRSLTKKARVILGLGPSTLFRQPHETPPKKDQGYSLAQKLVGLACGLAPGQGVLPGSYCEVAISTVGSQDTTGAMTRDEIQDLACLKFQADLVMQSFCHTAPYPKLDDIRLQQTLPDFITSRGGVALSVGDGVIHSWLNRLLLPNTVGTGGDSHTRFPMGISFPAGSGLVAFAAATGMMPLDMPESVLIRFKGTTLHKGITLRDLVNAIPLYAIKQGLLTLEKQGKKNIFSGRILEIEGLSHLKMEQAFELSDASAERSSSACAIEVGEEGIKEYLRSNIALIESMIGDGYQDAKTLEKRKKEMQSWINHPVMWKADPNASYAAIIEIPLEEITEPLLACPNDPDDIRPLSEVAQTKIDEVFIGSCMTNIGHFRAAGKILQNEKQLPVRLWLAPPTRMDAKELRKEGYYSIFGKIGARIEMPGCSLCMGNQAQVTPDSTVVSTSTRNFPNRLGTGANVFLASAELAAVCAKLGKIPNLKEYQNALDSLDPKEIYQYLNFDKMEPHTSPKAH